MKLHVKYNVNLTCKIVLQEQLEKLGIPFRITGLGEVLVDGVLSPELYGELESSLRKYGMEIIENPRDALVHQIKDIIRDMVYLNERPAGSRISVYLAKKLNLSYSYLSRIFSDATHTSIENYMILQRIERVKQLILEEKLTFTEVAWKLNFSSVAHLSNQFKKTTGLTPTGFQRIMERRNIRYSSARHS